MEGKGTFDGGCRNGNPGDAAWAFCLEWPDKRTLALMDAIPGKNSNNVAEYYGLIELLKRAKREGFSSLYVTGDSKLVIEQVNGNWKVKEPTLKVLHAQAVELMKQFKEVHLVWVPREQNKEADGMCDSVLESK